MFRALAALAGCCVPLRGPSHSLAHEADGGIDDDDELDGGLSHVVVPPSIESAVEATYPARALAERREGHVHLELQVDANGHVSDVRVLESAGEDFDLAASEAVRALRLQARNARRRAGALLRHVHLFLSPAA